VQQHFSAAAISASAEASIQSILATAIVEDKCLAQQSATARNNQQRLAVNRQIAYNSTRLGMQYNQ
jgi:hypothetical protein